jgi:hypothetical protein
MKINKKLKDLKLNFSIKKMITEIKLKKAFRIIKGIKYNFSKNNKKKKNKKQN